MVTVNTHLRTEDAEALRTYCRKHSTSPYRLLKSYLMDVIELSKLEEAQETVKVIAGKRFGLA